MKITKIGLAIGLSVIALIGISLAFLKCRMASMLMVFPGIHYCMAYMDCRKSEKTAEEEQTSVKKTISPSTIGIILSVLLVLVALTTDLVGIFLIVK